ncbi:PREDICTED: uncharacterized protein LOC105599981 [Cercocebus atys]|uniref:uncharacterized protein LOC105599981 n=1 Tax=Cercocebus atys TaxID=9531 RepID=UPI0005F3DA3A|nr:PREDICTED: uncharacterized protein LOC105599981 [Cercocebus atys]
MQTTINPREAHDKRRLSPSRPTSRRTPVPWLRKMCPPPMRSLPASGQGPAAARVEFAQLLPKSRDLENRSAAFSPRSSPKASQDTKSVPISAVSVQAVSQKKAIFGSLLSGVKVETRERGTCWGGAGGAGNPSRGRDSSSCRCCSCCCRDSGRWGVVAWRRALSLAQHAGSSRPDSCTSIGKTKKLKRSHQNSFHVGVINPTGDFLFCSTYKSEQQCCLPCWMQYSRCHLGGETRTSQTLNLLLP